MIETNSGEAILPSGKRMIWQTISGKKYFIISGKPPRLVWDSRFVTAEELIFAINKNNELISLEKGVSCEQ